MSVPEPAAPSVPEPDPASSPGAAATAAGEPARGAVEAALRDLSEHRDWRRELYTDLHRHPELGLEETATAQRITAELEALGARPMRIGGTGVVAVLTNGDGPVVLARADIDGLPVQERTGLPYASEVEGVMHACGHDTHVTALLGAVRQLLAHPGTWSGTYIALFQPAEETGEGARAMVEDGLAARIPHPDVALGQHVMPMPAGMIAVGPGPVMSQSDSLRITLHGRGAHGSMPHLSVDPVVLAASVVLRLQTVVSREVAPGEFSVLTIGALHAGTRPNIIADRAELQVNMRHYDPAVRDRVLAAVERVVRAECAASGAPRDPEIVVEHRLPPTINDPETAERVATAFRDRFGADRVVPMPQVTASEDFSVIPDALGVPYAYWLVGGGDPEAFAAAMREDGGAASLPVNHSPLFAPVVEPTLEAMTSAHVVAALAYLGRGSGRMGA